MGTGTVDHDAEAVADARFAGVVVLRPQRNAGADTPNYPAATRGVIGVAAEHALRPAVRRRRTTGLGRRGGTAAATSPPLAGSYDFFCGTSSATPLAAGAAALGLSLGASSAVVEAAMRSSAEPVGSWVERGRVDAAATLDAVELALGSPVHRCPRWRRHHRRPGAGTLTVERAAGSDRVATSIALARPGLPHRHRTHRHRSLRRLRRRPRRRATRRIPRRTRRAQPVQHPPRDVAR